MREGWKSVGGLVLMYHRIADLAFDPFSLAVTPAHFEEHLGVLRKYWEPVSLDEMAGLILDGKTPDRMVAVTFDDGYSDVFVNAKSALEMYGVPATAFLVTGQIGSDREYMWDELERIVLCPGTLPDRLCLGVAGQVIEWDLGEGASYSDADFSQYSEWKFESGQDPTPRHALFRKLYYLLKHAPSDLRGYVMDELLAWSGGAPVGRETHRAVTADEVRQISEAGLISIGAHTVSHPVLAGLPSVVQHREVVGGKLDLEDVLGRPVTTFAFPYGGPNDYTSETITILKETGYTCACTTLDGMVKVGSDLYQLPRLDVKDWPAGLFAERLLSALEG